MIVARSIDRSANLYFLLTIDERSGYVHVVKLRDRKSTTLTDAVLEVIGHYKTMGHSIGTIRFDGELAITAIAPGISLEGVKLHQVAPEQHVHRASGL